MTLEELVGCWTSPHELGFPSSRTLWLNGPATSSHAAGEHFSLHDYQGGDCGGTDHVLEGSWSLEGDVLTLRATKRIVHTSDATMAEDEHHEEPSSVVFEARIEAGPVLVLKRRDREQRFTRREGE